VVVLLPRKVDGLADVEKSLAKDGLKDVLKNLREQEVVVFVPKFKMESQFSLSETLKAMGMKDAFVFGAADFSGMNGRKDLFISAVVHKAFVDVNEEGTEAAAATAVVIETESIEPPPPVFRADHPFIFLIRHEKTGAILFIGRVTNPKE
ncbi:MAG: serpin family protein, partial [Planctomycetia bacterium]|nr:serpin family protein [Planctomycetia bacterium]